MLKEPCSCQSNNPLPLSDVSDTAFWLKIVPKRLYHQGEGLGTMPVGKQSLFNFILFIVPAASPEPLTAYKGNWIPYTISYNQTI